MLTNDLVDQNNTDFQRIDDKKYSVLCPSSDKDRRFGDGHSPFRRVDMALLPYFTLRMLSCVIIINRCCCDFFHTVIIAHTIHEHHDCNLSSILKNLKPLYGTHISIGSMRFLVDIVELLLGIFIRLQVSLLCHM